MNTFDALSGMINSWLKSHKITQTALAQSLGIKQATLSMMLSGKTKLPLNRLKEIISLLEPPRQESDKALWLYACWRSGIQDDNEQYSIKNLVSQKLDFFLEIRMLY